MYPKGQGATMFDDVVVGVVSWIGFPAQRLLKLDVTVETLVYRMHDPSPFVFAVKTADLFCHI
jgi:hypothetical protein